MVKGTDMTDHDEPIVTGAAIAAYRGEVIAGCFACEHAGESLTITRSSDLPLCTVHWNWWLTRWLMSDDAAPCSAHLLDGQR